MKLRNNIQRHDFICDIICNDLFRLQNWIHMRTLMTERSSILDTEFVCDLIKYIDQSEPYQYDLYQGYLSMSTGLGFPFEAPPSLLRNLLHHNMSIVECIDLDSGFEDTIIYYSESTNIYESMLYSEYLNSTNREYKNIKKLFSDNEITEHKFENEISNYFAEAFKDLSIKAILVDVKNYTPNIIKYLPINIMVFDVSQLYPSIGDVLPIMTVLEAVQTDMYYFGIDDFADCNTHHYWIDDCKHDLEGKYISKKYSLIDNYKYYFIRELPEKENVSEEYHEIWGSNSKHNYDKIELLFTI